jgi:hypothetical protein
MSALWGRCPRRGWRTNSAAEASDRSEALSAHARMSAQTAAFIFPGPHSGALLPVEVTVIVV